MSAVPTDDFARRARGLEERLDEAKPTSWRPDDPQAGHPNPIIGVLVRVEDNETRFGPTKIAVLRTADDTLWSVWLLTTVLKNEFAKLRPQPTEIVAIRYDGKVVPKGGGDPYAKYSVAVDHDGATIDWASDSGSSDPAPGPPAEPTTTRPPAFAGAEPEPEPEPPLAKRRFCEHCGKQEPDHADGCENDIPF